MCRARLRLSCVGVDKQDKGLEIIGNDIMVNRAIGCLATRDIRESFNLLKERHAFFVAARDAGFPLFKRFRTDVKVPHKRFVIIHEAHRLSEESSKNRLVAAVIIARNH